MWVWADSNTAHIQRQPKPTTIKTYYTAQHYRDHFLVCYTNQSRSASITNGLRDGHTEWGVGKVRLALKRLPPCALKSTLSPSRLSEIQTDMVNVWIWLHRKHQDKACIWSRMIYSKWQSTLSPTHKRSIFCISSIQSRLIHIHQYRTLIKPPTNSFCSICKQIECCPINTLSCMINVFKYDVFNFLSV